MKTIRIILLIFTIVICCLIFYGLTIGLRPSPKGYSLIPFFMSFILSFGILPVWITNRLEELIRKHESKLREEGRKEALRGFGDLLYDSRTKDPEFFKNVMTKDAPIGGVEGGTTTVYNRIIRKLEEFGGEKS